MKKLLSLCSLLGVLMQAQVSDLKENFNDFVTDKQASRGGIYGDLPQKGWSSSLPHPYAYVSKHPFKENKYLKAYSFFSGNVPIYFFTPELTSVEGTLIFYAGGSDGLGSLQVGVIENKENTESFQPIQDFLLEKHLTKYTLEIPKTAGKYIAFKYIPNANHLTFGLDNVTFVPKTLSTQEINKQEEVRINLASNGNLKIYGGNWTKGKIYGANGGLILNTKITQNNLNISSLEKGLYFIHLENENGSTFKTKFIK